MYFVESIIVAGHKVEVYAVEGEGLTASCEDFPHLDVSAYTMGDLVYELQVHLAVEEEMDRIWNSEGVIEEEEEN